MHIFFLRCFNRWLGWSSIQVIILIVTTYMAQCWVATRVSQCSYLDCILSSVIACEGCPFTLETDQSSATLFGDMLSWKSSGESLQDDDSEVGYLAGCGRLRSYEFKCKADPYRSMNAATNLRLGESTAWGSWLACIDVSLGRLESRGSNKNIPGRHCGRLSKLMLISRWPIALRRVK